MARDRLHERITDQFSYRGERADIWRGFDHVLDTDEFLNLGYSEWYQPHVLGSPQLRLARKIGADLVSHVTESNGSLLDIGCGRGGPSIYLTERFGFDCTGIDLVPYNVEMARANADRRGVSTQFVVGDARRLPFASDTFAACVAIDSLVYVPEKESVFESVARVLRPGGTVVISDLLVRDDVGRAGREAVDAFADSWDMPPLSNVEQYRTTMERAGLTVEHVRDISENSIDRFQKWTDLYLLLVTHAGNFSEQVLRRWNLDASAIAGQVRTASSALSRLSHVIIVAHT